MSRRPATIAQLAEQARNVNWDEHGTVKYFLRQAEKERKAGAQYFDRKDLENAFVAFARAASLILEKIPSHREYEFTFSATQKSNLALNGQEILDNLGHLKRVLLDRYDKWVQLHPNGEQDLGSAMDNLSLDPTSHAKVQEELDLWRKQREEAQRHDDDGPSGQRWEAAMNSARQAAGAPPPASIQYRPPAGPRKQEERVPSASTVTMPAPAFPSSLTNPLVPPSMARPPSFSDKALTLPLENPSRYEGESTDSETVSNNWHRRVRQTETTPYRQPVRSPSYPPPITTTSPPPPEVSHIQYPQLMSPHQRTQGYMPSLNSMFIQGPRSGPSLGSSSLLFDDNQSKMAYGGQPLYSTNLLPQPSVAPATTYIAPTTYTLPDRPRPHSSSAVPPPDNVERNASSSSSQSGHLDLKKVNLPRDSLPRFLAIANVNTERNRETCGLLLGKNKGNKYVVTTLLVPKQHSTSDTCTMDEEELVMQFTEERNLITLGWIHTHPTQSCFMSSVDLHTHSGFQRMLPESFAVVCAPKSNPKFGIFRLTDPPGLRTILECKATAAFHPHPELPIYTDADKGHVQMRDLALEIVDLR